MGRVVTGSVLRLNFRLLVDLTEDATALLGAALADLLGAPPNSLAVNEWVGTLQYVPAVAGGIFGLLGGYLTDLFGRRRVLVWSILLYALSALAAGYATSVGWLLFWRCCTFVGVCVEFVAAVAWLSELFPDAKQRERVVGYTQAFGSIGGLMVTGAYYVIVTYGHSFPEVQGGHAFHVMDAYVRWLEGSESRLQAETARSAEERAASAQPPKGGTLNSGRRALALLQLLGLFDRPATADCLQALWQAPAIAGLTEPLIGLTEAQRNLSLKRLEDARLLTVNRDAAGKLLARTRPPTL